MTKFINVLVITAIVCAVAAPVLATPGTMSNVSRLAPRSP